MRAFPLALALMLPAAVLAGEQTTPQPARAGEQQIEATFGDWSKICTTNQNDQHVCQIVQSANQNESGKLVFQTAVGYVADNEKPIMYLTAPLGIFLPRGISIFVGDEENGITATVQRCDASGCLGVLALEDSLVDKLKQGNEARLVFAANVQQNVALPLSLAGFTKAFNSLEKPAAPPAGTQ